MEIVELATGRRKPVSISRAEDKDFRILTEKRFTFDWISLKETTTVYKLQLCDTGDILGVMGLIDFPGEQRIEISLLASSRENRGKNKKYDRIAGCLIAFACKLAAKKYEGNACVSLVPKTALVKHYMSKYSMRYAGWQLYVEGQDLDNLIKEYINEKEKSNGTVYP